MSRLSPTGESSVTGSYQGGGALPRTKGFLAIFLALTCILSLLECTPASVNRPIVQSNQLSITEVKQPPKVVLFIGDGMGVGVLSIGHLYSRYSLGGDLNLVRLARRGTCGYVITGSETSPVTDSAASATALATGVRTANGMVGMTSDSVAVENIFELAARMGLATGFVTTTSVTDATPACFLAHVPDRRLKLDIALQIVECDAAVVLGGGYWYFLPPDSGLREDGRDLTEAARKAGFRVVFDRQSLLTFEGERLLGLFAPDDLPYEGKRPETEIPSLMEMVRVAVEVLEKDPDGFMLVVEGGRIDHAEHENSISDAIGELLAFDQAIGYVMRHFEGDSLATIIVTADHDCGGPAITVTDDGYPRYSDLESLVSDQCPIVEWVSTSHTASMVPILAIGRQSEGFLGVLENTDIYHKIRSVLGF